jgi:hypothetical protein
MHTSPPSSGNEVKGSQSKRIKAISARKISWVVDKGYRPGGSDKRMEIISVGE